VKDFRYIPGVSSLRLDQEACIGCGMCVIVCPHGVMAMGRGKAEVVDFDGCMECGACAVNCPAEAVALNPGVGCAALIIKRRLGRGIADSCC
jgi:NAD-dependent dihydropyrimidine dehydrogenase PreA subunit